MSVSNAETFLMSVRIGSASPSAAGDSGSASERDACFKRDNVKSSAQKPLSTQLSAVVVEHDGAGRSAVHNLGQASVGIGKFVDQGSRVLALYTGGTMGMKPDRNGRLAPVKGYLTEQIKELLKQHEEEPLPRVEVQEWDELLDSCDVGPDQWRKVALDIQQRYEEVEGFVVIMGTDTMAYTASALSFMLENLGKTVIITGSQVPFGRINSDARRNLLFAFALACTLDIPEVCIVFDRVLLRGVRSRKEDSGSFAAFCSPFISPLATLGLSVQVNTSLILPQPKGAFRVQDNMQTRVIVLKIVPSFDMLALHRCSPLCC
jgi:L-asparaginase